MIVIETRKFEKNPFLLKIITPLALGVGMLVLAVLSIIFINPYGILIAITLFLLSVIIDIFGILSALSYVNCPKCARTMKRKSLQKAEYACEVCGINWILEK